MMSLYTRSHLDVHLPAPQVAKINHRGSQQNTRSTATNGRPWASELRFSGKPTKGELVKQFSVDDKARAMSGQCQGSYRKLQTSDGFA